jgi:Cdc6-like AAA superfamily ATPase
MKSDGHFERMHEAAEVFTPGSPINRRDFFAGRREQLDRVVESIMQPGRHPIIYGRRGVGKTSLANIVTEQIKNVEAVKVTCDGADTFRSIWSRILKDSTFEIREKPFGLARNGALKELNLGQFLQKGGNTTPAEIGTILKHLDRVRGWPIVILDEFRPAATPKSSVLAPTPRTMTAASLRPRKSSTL